MCKFRPENIDLIKKSQFHYTTCMSGTRQATRYKLTANDSRSITEKAVASTTRPRRDKTSLTPTLLNHRSSNMGRRTQMYHLRSTITKFKFLKLVFHIEFQNKRNHVNIKTIFFTIRLRKKNTNLNSGFFIKYAENLALDILIINRHEYNSCDFSVKG